MEVDSNRGTMIVREVVVNGGGQVEGEWSCYRGGHFNRGKIVMLQR